MAAKTSKKPRRFKWLRRLAIALVVYALLGFFVVPAIIKWQMVKQVSALTHRHTAVEKVRFNPFALSLTIRGFSLKDPDGAVFTSFDEFYVNFQPVASLFKWTWVFREISLKKPFAQVTHRADGTFNFADLLTGTNVPAAKPSQTAKPSEPPRLLVYSLSITNAGFAFADLARPEPFKKDFTPINLELTNLTTVRDHNSPYSFVVRTDAGESFAWSGTITVNPLRSAGEFRLGGLKFPRYHSFSRDFARFEIANGTLDVAADYRYNSSTNALDLQLSNAAVHLSNLQLKSPDTGETVIAIPLFSITNVTVDVPQQTASVGMIRSTGGSFLVRQEHDGVINLLALLNPPTNNTAAGSSVTNVAVTSTAPPKPWSAKIDEISFADYTVKLEDMKPEKSAAINLDQIAFDVKGVSNASNAPVNATFSLRFQETGTLSLNGTATLMPPSADLQIALTNIDLRAIQPYLQEQLKLAITSGGVNLRGRAQYASHEPGAPLVSFNGSLAVNKLATTDDVLFKDFAKWDALEVTGIKLALQPNELHVDDVKFTGLATSVIIGPDHRLNLQSILREKPTNSPTVTNAAPASAPAAPFAMTLGAFELEKSSLHFSDHSLDSHAAFDVQEFGGAVRGLSSDPNTTADVDFHGTVDARSPFSVTGRVNPLSTNLFVNIAVAFTNTDLTPLTPYTEKYVGRQLQKGKLSFGVHYDIKDKALKAENDFFIDQFTFGAKTDSPDATSLPVGLAVKLLKDRNGRIKLDVPLSGRIDDPKFKVGPIIWHVVENLIAKAATSPFSLLGAAFGGGEEMSFVTFQPGLSDLPSDELSKLDNLAKALYDRPEVQLSINGSTDPAIDRLPVAHYKLDQRIRSAFVKELTDAGKPPVAISEVKLEAADRERLLRQIYKQDIGWYQPTPVPTNSADTNSVAARLAALPKVSDNERGATKLIETSAKSKTATKKPSQSAKTSAAPKPTAAPTTRAELELLDMENQLVARIQVTSNDLRNLMLRRAAAVHNYLLKTGKVTNDRLFDTAPKTIDASFKGDTRVNLSLE